MSTFLILWFFALIAQSDARYRRHTIDILRNQGFRHLYTFATWRPLARLWARLCDPVPKSAGLVQIFRAALTWRLYDRALLIAVAYPIFALVGIWLLTGADGRLGATVILKGPGFWFFWPDRALILLILLILIFGLIGRKLGAHSPHGVIRQAADWLPLPAVGLASSLAGAYAGLVAAAFVFASTLAFALQSANAGALAVAGAFAFAGVFTVVGVFISAGAIAGALISFWLDWQRRQSLTRLLLTQAVPIIWIVLAARLNWPDVVEPRRAIFLFLGVFPLINALFDVLSYTATLSFMRLGLRRWNPVLAALADLGCAVLLFLALGITLTALITLLNKLAGVPLVDLGVLFAEIKERPTNHLWVFLMLFSTILPTALHFAFAIVLGAQSLVHHRLRAFTADMTNATIDDTAPFAPVLAPPLVALVGTFPLVVLWGLIWLASVQWWPLLKWFLGSYHSLLLKIAHHGIGAF